VRLTRSMPFAVLRCYLFLIGFFYFIMKHADMKKIAVCLRYVLHLNQTTPQTYIDIINTYKGIIEHYYEKLIMAHRPLTEMFEFLSLRLHVANSSRLDRIAKSGKGAILVTGHFGAVEFLPLAMSIKGYKIAMICRFKTAKLREELIRKARKFDVMLIDADKPKVTFRALKAIKEGRILITECDEFSEWRPHRKQQIHLFGHRIPRDRTLDFFYRRAGVPAFMGLMKREKGRFVLTIDDLADGSSETSLAARAWKKLESYIFQYPQQWYQWKEAAVQLHEPIALAFARDNRQRVLRPTSAESPALATKTA